MFATSKRYREKNSGTQEDDGYFYKRPRENDYLNLINEFVALKLASGLVKITNLSVKLPDVSITLKENQYCLKIASVPGFQSLDELKQLSTSYDKVLLECLLIDLITGNIDGHVQNIGTDNEGRLNHFDFDLAFALNKISLIDDIKTIADTAESGFAQRCIYPGLKHSLVVMLNKIITVPDLENELQKVIESFCQKT